jgi:hypothetical protein
MIVTEDRFEVGLSFSGVPERLVIPFRAITGFADPSVQFGLQFSVPGSEDETAGTEPARTETARSPARVESVPATPSPTSASAAKPEPKAENEPTAGGEVVRLDRFRKK